MKLSSLKILDTFLIFLTSKVFRISIPRENPAVGIFIENFEIFLS